MGHDAPRVEPERAIAIIAGDRFRPEMTARDVRAAGGLVICGAIPDGTKEAIEKFAVEHGHRVEIVIVEPKFIADVAVEAPKYKDVQTFVIERQLEAKVVRERSNAPPWMGKKPWWQR